MGWFSALNTFIAEIDDIENSNYDCCDEFGLQCAQDGITWMRSTTAPQSMRIRSSAQLITIFMSDEEAQTIQDNPLSGPAGVAKLTDFQIFFSANTIAFAIVGDRNGSTGGTCGSSDGKAYRQVALSTGCLLYTSPSPRDKRQSRMPSSA